MARGGNDNGQAWRADPCRSPMKQAPASRQRPGSGSAGAAGRAPHQRPSEARMTNSSSSLTEASITSGRATTGSPVNLTLSAKPWSHHCSLARARGPPVRRRAQARRQVPLVPLPPQRPALRSCSTAARPGAQWPRRAAMFMRPSVACSSRLVHSHRLRLAQGVGTLWRADAAARSSITAAQCSHQLAGPEAGGCGAGEEGAPGVLRQHTAQAAALTWRQQTRAAWPAGCKQTHAAFAGSQPLRP